VSKHWDVVTEASVTIVERARHSIAVGVAALLVASLSLEYSQIQRQARTDLQSINTTLESRLCDGLLIPMEQRFATIAAGARDSVLHHVSAGNVNDSRDRSSLFADVEGIVITDLKGHVLSGAADPSTNYWALFSSGGFTTGSTVSRTRVAVDAPRRLLLAVPINGTADEIIGWVVGGISLNTVRKSLVDVSLGRRGVVTLRLTSQPVPIIRVPEMANRSGLPRTDEIDEAATLQMPDGPLQRDSIVDGVTRLYGLTRVGSFDLVLLTGISVSDYLSTWYWTLVTSLSITIGFLILGSRSLKKARKGRQRELRIIAALRDNVEKTDLLLQSVGQAILGIDSMGRCTFCNPTGLALFGVEAERLIGHSINANFCSSGDKDCDFTRRILSAVCEGNKYQTIFDSLHDAQGTTRPVEVFAYPSYADGNVVGAVLVLNDISERLKSERALAHLAYHDSLTGLPNRNGFEEHLKTLTAEKKKVREAFSIAYIDVDEFRYINAALGQSFGDAVLKEVANRLKAHRKLTTVSRFGDALFAAVITDSANANFVAQALQSAMKRPWNNGLELPISVSIGLASFPENGFKPDDLQTAADVALNSAKLFGQDSIRHYNKIMGDSSSRRFDLQNLLGSAISRGELTLEYQPKIDTTQGKIYGAEALLRWVSPSLGLVSPAEFIPIAEANGLIIPITEWVVNKACAQIAKWEQLEIGPIQMSINFAALHFKRGNLYETVRCALQRHMVPPHLLELELTESAAIEDSDTALNILKRLRLLGVGLSIDDFGTGYSNLAYLKRFDITTLKIDRSFVSKLPNDRQSASIVQAIILLAKELDLDVIAEGVESRESLLFINELGCSKIQGFFYSRSLTPHGFEDYFKNFKSKAA
jgi:diguanylate cyclase (GGDEF)-like protein/PAS domain S-box-containing protein